MKLTNILKEIQVRPNKKLTLQRREYAGGEDGHYWECPELKKFLMSGDGFVNYYEDEDYIRFFVDYDVKDEEMVKFFKLYNIPYRINEGGWFIVDNPKKYFVLKS